MIDSNRNYQKLLSRIFAVVVGIILLALISVQYFTWQQVRQNFYGHRPASTYTLEQFGLTAKEFNVVTADGLKLEALHIPVKDSKAIIVIVHGASDDGGKTVMLPYAKFLNEAGYSTITFALRNYAGGEGDKTTFGVKEWQDVSAAYDLAEQLEPNKPIGLLGSSMGAASLLTAMGKKGIGDFAVAGVPYTTFGAGASWDTQNKMGIPQWFSRPFIEFAAFAELGPEYFENQPLHVIKKIDVPVLLISAKNDKKVNPQDSYELQKLGGINFSVWQSEIAAHDLLNTDGKAYKEEVLKFIGGNLD
jgi:alpha-beta hydrolase superfamily lysophospholipase